MISKSQTSSLTMTQQEYPGRWLILRLRSHANLEDIENKLRGASSEEVQNKIKATKTRAELQQRVDELLDGLKIVIDNSLRRTQEAVRKMIPKRPEKQSIEAQQAYIEEIRKFELLFSNVEKVLVALEELFENVFNKITQFYTNLWEDCFRTKKDSKKKADKFRDELEKEYSEMVKYFQDLTN